MKMNNKVYDILKWTAQIFLPALITLFGTIGAVLDLECTQTVITIAIAFDTFLGTLLGISTMQYNKSLTDENGGEDNG